MLDIPIQVVSGQILIGLINGSFYAVLSLGLAVIFGLLRVINFAHGAQYMLGAVTAWLLLQYAGIGFWPALICAPAIVGAIAWVIERFLLRRIYGMDHLFGLLLTFGMMLIIEGVARYWLGVAGKAYAPPAALRGIWNFGFVIVPIYRGFVVAASLAACLTVWLLIEKTKIGSYLRAATEDAPLVESFGVNVPRLMSFAYVLGAALAAFAGVLAAPIYQVSPLMGSHLIIVVFAVVVAGGMGSILGSVVTGLSFGVLEGLTKLFYPQASSVIIFVLMAIVLIARPQGLFGRDSDAKPQTAALARPMVHTNTKLISAMLLGLIVVLLAAPYVVYPLFLVQILCFALFASAFNLLIGYAGLLSFGHAAFFGSAAYVTAYMLKVWGWPPELGIVAGMAVAALLGLVIGSLAVKRQGIYFAMITLALSQVVYFVFLQSPFAGGEDGIQAVPQGRLLGLIDLSNPMVLYYAVLVIVGLAMALLWRIIHSPFGEVLGAIRENEARATSLGYFTDRYKLGAFVMSATLAGLAGSLYVISIQIASLSSVTWQVSGEVILMTLLGGMGTFFGPAAGAAIVFTIDQYMASSPIPAPVVTGLLFVACVLAFRRGIVGEASQRLATKFNKKTAQHTSSETHRPTAGETAVPTNAHS
jgi:branched-chain amino acid transport system permease protein